MINKHIQQYIECLEKDKFYEAHEALEEIWFPKRFENSNEVKLLKGFINAAVSFELLKKGRPVQSKKVWMNYLKYRQLLYRIDSRHYNAYHCLARKVESYKSVIEKRYKF